MLLLVDPADYRPRMRIVSRKNQGNMIFSSPCWMHSVSTCPIPSAYLWHKCLEEGRVHVTKITTLGVFELFFLMGWTTPVPRNVSGLVAVGPLLRSVQTEIRGQFYAQLNMQLLTTLH